MNPYANLYLMVDKQHQRDLARTYRNAQRGWNHPDFPNQSEYRTVRKSRIAVAMGRLRRRQSPANLASKTSTASTASTASTGGAGSVTSVNTVDARVRRAHAA